MPSNLPLAGETWATRDAFGKSTEGVIAEVTPTIITMVSITGYRIRVSPERVLGYWHFVQGIPATGLTCERGGCKDVAIFRTERDGLIQHICARHTPIGTMLHRIDGVGHIQLPKENGPDLSCRSCLTCGNAEVTEDLSLPRAITDPWRWWTCILCDSIWMVLPPVVGIPDMTTIRLAIRFVESKGANIEAVHTGSGSHTSLLAEGYKLTLDPSLKPDDVLLRLSRRARLNLRPPMPVQKLGGRPMVDEPPPPAPPDTWRNHLTREVVEVTHEDEAVHFRPVGSVNGATTMLKDDFVRIHEPNKAEDPPFEVSVGDEWENTDGEAYRVLEIDGKNQYVVLQNPFGMKRISFRAFKKDNWRRVIRRNAFDMLMED